MKNHSLLGCATFVLIFIIGCTWGKYIPPPVITTAPDAFTQVIDRPYDSIWSDAIQYVATSRFHIEHFEKASGLITLSYISLNPSELISGGHVEVKGKQEFSGDCIDYLVKEAEGYLQGNVNIIVIQVDPDRTRVTVKVTYSFTATIPDEGTYSWSFDTGGSDTRFVPAGISSPSDTITIVPTYRAEKTILNAIAKRE